MTLLPWCTRRRTRQHHQMRSRTSPQRNLKTRIVWASTRLRMGTKIMHIICTALRITNLMPRRRRNLSLSPTLTGMSCKNMSTATTIPKYIPSVSVRPSRQPGRIEYVRRAAYLKMSPVIDFELANLAVRRPPRMYATSLCTACLLL